MSWGPFMPFYHHDIVDFIISEVRLKQMDKTTFTSPQGVTKYD